MKENQLKKALRELLRRTREGNVRWSSATKEMVRAKLDNLWVFVSAEGKVKLWKSERIDHPPWKTHRSKFVFKSDLAQEIYVEARSQDPPESSQIFIDKMLSDG